MRTGGLTGGWVLLATLAGGTTPAPPQAAPAPVLDRVLAIVRGTPITLSEVEEAIALNPGAVPPPGHEEMLETMIAARLMEQEARRYVLEPPSEEETDRTLAALQDRFPSPEAYRETLFMLGIREDYLRKQIRRELMVDDYVERRFLPLVQIPRREVEDYYRTVLLPDLDAGSPPALAEVEALIRDILIERDLNRRISAWVDELKSAARIVRLSLEGSPPAG